MGVLVCIVSNIEDHIQSYFQHLTICQIVSAVFKNCNDLSTFSLVASQLPDADIFENSIPTERNKIKHKTPSTHCGPIFHIGVTAV